MVKSYSKMYALPLLAWVLIGGIATLNSVAMNSDTFGDWAVFKTQGVWAGRWGNLWGNPGNLGGNAGGGNAWGNVGGNAGGGNVWGNVGGGNVWGNAWGNAGGGNGGGNAATFIACPAANEFLAWNPITLAYRPQYFNAVQVNGPIVNTLQINFNGRDIPPHPQYRIWAITASLTIPNIAMPHQLTCTYEQATPNPGVPAQAQFSMFQNVPVGAANCVEVNTPNAIGFNCR